MTDWTSGYVADIGYTYGYYAELNPARVKLALLNAGLAFPDMGTACELGFGQGVSANFHAAASLTSWHGTDFNPSQAGFAQELARMSGSGAQLFDEAFDAFCARDLPDFDYIGLHGIWSWISDANRAVIVDFVRRKLKVGGVLYISYNTLPGWGAFAPMRHLLTQHAEVVGAVVPRDRRDPGHAHRERERPVRPAQPDLEGEWLTDPDTVGQRKAVPDRKQLYGRAARFRITPLAGQPGSQSGPLAEHGHLPDVPRKFSDRLARKSGVNDPGVRG